jgi:hypothetical protein
LALGGARTSAIRCFLSAKIKPLPAALCLPIVAVDGMGNNLR